MRTEELALESLYLDLTNYFHGYSLSFSHEVTILLQSIVWDIILALVSLGKPERLVHEWFIPALSIRRSEKRNW